jgi:hypothetical protein
MAGMKLDGPGLQKMKTIDEAFTTLQTIHGLVERMAVDVRNQIGVGATPQQIKRIATPLQGQLKVQFGAIADQVAAMILACGRGGGDQLKVRALREFVGQIRQAADEGPGEARDRSGPRRRAAGVSPGAGASPCGSLPHAAPLPIRGSTDRICPPPRSRRR